MPQRRRSAAAAAGANERELVFVPNERWGKSDNLWCRWGGRRGRHVDVRCEPVAQRSRSGSRVSPIGRRAVPCRRPRVRHGRRANRVRGARVARRARLVRVAPRRDDASTSAGGAPASAMVSATIAWSASAGRRANAIYAYANAADGPTYPSTPGASASTPRYNRWSGLSFDSARARPGATSQTRRLGWRAGRVVAPFNRRLWELKPPYT
jgi:hypothetical protein